MKKLVLLFLLGCCVRLWASVPADEKYYCAITISHSLCTATPDSYPFPWILNQSDMPSGATGLWANCNATDGRDIRFTSDSAGLNALHCEIKNFVQATPAALFFIGLTAACSLTHTTDGTVYVWYGSTTAAMPDKTDATWGSNGVWDSNFAAVYHGTEASGNMIDSTSNGNALTPSGTVGTTTGAFGPARSFGTSKSCAASSTSPDFSVSTVEMWFANVNEGNCDIIDNFDVTGSYGQLCWYCGTGDVYFNNYWGNNALYCDPYFKIPTTGGSAYFGTATSLAITQNNSRASTLMYLNGATQIWSNRSGAQTTPTPIASCGTLCVGWDRGYAYGNGFNGGWVEEIRISTSVRSADWIATSYNNQANIATSGTPGTPVYVGTSSAVHNSVILIDDSWKATDFDENFCEIEQRRRGVVAEVVEAN